MKSVFAVKGFFWLYFHTPQFWHKYEGGELKKVIKMLKALLNIN